MSEVKWHFRARFVQCHVCIKQSQDTHIFDSCSTELVRLAPATCPE